MEQNTNNILKASRFEIEQQLNPFIGNLKVEGISAEGKLSLVLLKLELSKVIKEIESFRETTLKSIEKPENYDELEQAANKENATEEDKEAFKKAQAEYNNKFAEVAIPYFNEIVDIPFDFISKDDFKELVKHNDANVVFGYEYVYNKLVKQ